jgi:transposase
MPGPSIRLAPAERRELQARVRSQVLRAGDVRRARLILMLAAGESWSSIGTALGCNSGYIDRWKKRFDEQRLAGLFGRHRGRRVEKRTPKLEAKILEWTRRPPTDGSTHWSSRRLAKALGVNHMMVARVWKRAGLRPHRLDRYMASNDPDFETKAADVIGLYLNPPQHAAVFCVDEKTAIQALDRLDPVLPLSPGRAERHGFEYYRHGTLSLYAALNTRTGTVLGQTASRHTTEEFVAFLAQLVALETKGREIHIILDNLSTHKTQRVRNFLAQHSNVYLHFTPTYSSWLNQVEIWFSKIERDVIARGVFTSVPDLARKLMRYIRHHNRAAKPIKWAYRDASHRIQLTSVSAVTVH